MARFENEGRSPRFYEVFVDDTLLITRHGRVGTDGKATVKDTGSKEKAGKEADKRIAEKLKADYKLVSQVPDDFDEKVDPGIEAAILEAPDETGGFLVYADWLQAQADPRGELITLQAGGETKAADKLLEKHKARFLPPRTSQMSKKPRRKDKHASGYTDLGWSHGFIRTAHLARNSDRPPFTVREMVEELLTHPSARLLDSLTIGPLGLEEKYDYGDVIRAIARLRPEALRALFVGDFAAEHNEIGFASLGDLSGLSRLPRLSNLRLRGGSVTLEGLVLPELQSFTLETQEASKTLQRELSVATWPKLLTLSLTVKNAPLDPGSLDALFHQTSLRQVTFSGTKQTGGLVSSLLVSPLLRTLEHLDLSNGDLDDDDVNTLLSGSDRLTHLESLSLERNYLSEEATKRLHELGPKRVVTDNQQKKVAAGVEVTDAMIQRFAEDPKSVTAARKVAKPNLWSGIGRQDAVLWGTHPGSSGTYEVFADAGSMNAGCTCPSRKYPCKHALGLLLMAADGQGFPDASPPAGLLDRAAAGRYDTFWE